MNRDSNSSQDTDTQPEQPQRIGCSNKVAGIIMLVLIIICAIVVGITDDGNLIDCQTGGCIKIGGG